MVSTGFLSCSWQKSNSNHPLKSFHCLGVFPVEVISDRREQHLPAVADFGVPVLLQHYRQIPCQPCRLHMIEPQVVGGEAEYTSSWRRGCRYRPCMGTRWAAPCLDDMLFRAHGALVVGRRCPRDGHPAFPVAVAVHSNSSGAFTPLPYSIVSTMRAFASNGVSSRLSARTMRSFSKPFSRSAWWFSPSQEAHI